MPQETTTDIPTDVPAEVMHVAHWLLHGKPELGWRGDDKLELRIALLMAASSGYSEEMKRRVHRGEVCGKRIEVWRHCEDGEDRRIGSWHLHEWADIIADMVKMDPSSPAHVSTEARIDAANRRKEVEQAARMTDKMGELMEYAARLHHDRTKGPSTFRGVQGLNPDKQL